MQFQIVDVLSVYRRLMNTPNARTREAIFRDELAAPFDGLVKIFGGEPLSTFKMWGMTPEMFVEQSICDIITTLAEHHAWEQTAQALHDGATAFANHDIPLDTIVFALLVYQTDVPGQRGYSGFGGIPGYIMTTYSEANDYALPRIKAATAHELHHNIRFTQEPFNPMQATVGQYIVAEGLAESFAASLYGEDTLGYFVTDFNDTQLAKARQVIGDALDATGFNTIRAYVFGDTIAERMGLEKAGVPDYAGYGIGYRVVQTYLKRTGQSVVEATVVPYEQIIAESGFFSR